MKNIIARANKKLSVGWAASLLSASFMVSAVLGLLRDRLLFANFPDAVTDAYFTAFRIPDFMFVLLVSGALSVTFIPVFAQRYSSGQKESAWQIGSSMINLLAIVTFFLSLAMLIFAPTLINLSGAGLDPEAKETAASLMRIIAVNPFLFSISSILSSMQQAVGRFFFNSLAPIIYNFGIIFGILVLAPALGTDGESNILGVALGVALGSIIQLLVQLLGMFGLGFQYKPMINWKNKGFRKVLGLFPPRSFDQGIDYFITLFENNLTTIFFAVGATTSYQAALTLRNVPITIIGVAISTAAFPLLSKRADSPRTDLFRKDLAHLLRVVLWLGIGAVVVTFFMRGYLVRMLKADGDAAAASLLGWFTVSILMRALFQVISRAFYAKHDTKTPLMVSVAALGMNLVLALALIKVIGLNGIAAAQSVVALFEVAALLAIIRTRYGHLFGRHDFVQMTKMLTAGVVAGLVNYWFVRIALPLRASDIGFFSLAPKFVLIVAVTLLTYAIVSYLLKITEAKPVIRSIVSFVYKSVKFNK